MNLGEPHSTPGQTPRDFATTHWSLVLTAGQAFTPDARQALETLCQIYWQPLYLYIRRRVTDLHEAQDLTQAFFAELLEKHYLAAATPERGRFRGFLLTACKHFLSRQWDQRKALKRGGGRAPLSLDFGSADSTFRIDPPGGLTPEQLYDREWVTALLGQILERLESELTRSGKADQFARLKDFLIGDHAGTSYAQVAAHLNISEAAAKKAASRLRARYRALLREEIAQTVTTPEEVDDEIRRLFAALTDKI